MDDRYSAIVHNYKKISCIKCNNELAWSHLVVECVTDDRTESLRGKLICGQCGSFELIGVYSSPVNNKSANIKADFRSLIVAHSVLPACLDKGKKFLDIVHTSKRPHATKCSNPNCKSPNSVFKNSICLPKTPISQDLMIQAQYPSSTIQYSTLVFLTCPECGKYVDDELYSSSFIISWDKASDMEAAIITNLSSKCPNGIIQLPKDRVFWEKVSAYKVLADLHKKGSDKAVALNSPRFPILSDPKQKSLFNINDPSWEAKPAPMILPPVEPYIEFSIGLK